MKSKSCIKPLALFATIAFSMHAHGAPVTKGSTGTDLADVASWGGSAPTSTDTATWTGTSLGAGLTLDTNVSWNGIKATGATSDIGVTGAGTLTLGTGGIDLSASTVNMSIANNLVLDGNQTWKAAAGRTLSASGVISGSAGLTFGALAQSVTSATFLTTADQTLFTSTSLADVTATSGKMGGAWVGGGTPINATGYLLSNNGSTATYWLEALDGGYTKGVAITLTQSGSDITAKATAAEYVSGSNLGYNFNTGGTVGTLATTQIGGGYGAHTTTLKLGYDSTGTIVLSGVNTYSGPTAVNAGILRAGVASVAGVGGAFGNNSAVSIANVAGTGIDLNGFNTQIGSLTGGGSSGGNITLGSANLTVGGDNTSPAAYAGVISGSGGSLTKTGTGTLVLTGANTYTGGTTVNTGILQVGNGSGASATLAGNTQIGANGTLKYSYGTTGAVLAGNLSGSGTLMLTRGGTGIVDLRVQGDNSGFTGAVVVDGGGYETTLRCASANALNANNAVTLSNFGSLSSWTYGLDSYDITVGSLASSDSNTYVRLGGAGGATRGLTVGADNTSTIFAGVIKNDAGGTGTLTKMGSGTLTLTGTSTYGGTTTVSAGTLLVSGALGNTAVSVAANATIGGTGSIAGSLALDGNSFLTIADINDALSVTGTVSFGTGFGVDNIVGWDFANAADGTYTLLAGSNINLANLDNLGLANAANLGNGRFAYFQQGSLQMVIVPEPRAALLGGLGLLALFRRRRS